MSDDFWSSYVEPELPPFITKEAKDELVESGVAFHIFNIRSGDTASYGSKWFVDANFSEPVSAQVSEDEDKQTVQSLSATFSFKKGTGNMREQMLEQMQTYLGEHDAIPVKLVKTGRAYTFASA
jgi:hypothetical protein